MNKSPTKHEFAMKRYVEKLEKDPHDENALFMVEYYDEADEKDKLIVNKNINKLKPMLQTMKKEAKTKGSEGAKEKTPGGFKSGLV